MVIINRNTIIANFTNYSNKNNKNLNLFINASNAFLVNNPKIKLSKLVFNQILIPVIFSPFNLTLLIFISVLLIFIKLIKKVTTNNKNYVGIINFI